MRWFCLIGLTLFIPHATFFAQNEGTAPAKVLVLTGMADLPHHVWQETTAAMKDILTTSGRFDVQVSEDPKNLDTGDLERFDVLLLNYHGPRFPGSVESAIEEFVLAGGGFIAVHQASYGPFFGQERLNRKWQVDLRKEWKAFSMMIGARWEPENIGHAKRTTFTVDWLELTHPISSGLSPSFIADDELYHKITLSPGVLVLAEGLSPADLGGTGKREPLVWINKFGEGRVLFTPLGHDSKAWRRPGMADLLSRAVEWTGTGRVTIAPVSRDPLLKTKETKGE